MPTAALRGIDVYYEHRGSGPRLLFVNGSGATLATVAVLLDVLAGRFELLAHDQRGLGRTSVPDAVPTMADYALDAAALADHVGWDRFRVVGISFGGMVAQELAVTVPERVERLALLCTSPGGDGGSSYPLHELGSGEAQSSLLDTRFTPEWLAEHPDDAAIVEQFTNRYGGGPPPAGNALQLEARRHHDVWDRLERIACPTLVAAGRYDGIAPLANSEAIVSRVPGAELRVYDGGHLFVLQDRRALPETLEFLASS
jgi:pimeloyl-ACP methyl ester carboxylesterase